MGVVGYRVTMDQCQRHYARSEQSEWRHPRGTMRVFPPSTFYPAAVNKAMHTCILRMKGRSSKYLRAQALTLAIYTLLALCVSLSSMPFQKSRRIRELELEPTASARVRDFNTTATAICEGLALLSTHLLHAI